MRIAIWGMGISGVSALRYLLKNTQNEVIAVDRQDPEQWSFREEILSLVSKTSCYNEASAPKDLDQIILSPGVDRRSSIIQNYISQGVEVINDVELAFRASQIPFIAITGSNGKTTTTTMMKNAFEIAGKKVFCGGNIGVPVCDLFEGDFEFAVLELSSFQLESIKSFHPKVAIILNITPTHMERYDHFDDYKKAKLNITRNLTKEDLYIAPKDILQDKINSVEISALNGYDFSQSRLIGDHQKENLFCVQKTLEFFTIQKVEDIMQELINEFSGVKYRLQFEAQVGNLNFINDAKSTNIDATISALKSLSSNDLILILGGQLRSDDVSFIQGIKPYKIARVYVFGQARDLLQEALRDDFEIVSRASLKDVMTALFSREKSGTVLFSPAFPSFDQFKNYMDRGESFSRLVKLNSI